MRGRELQVMGVFSSVELSRSRLLISNLTIPYDFLHFNANDLQRHNIVKSTPTGGGILIAVASILSSV